LFDEGPCPDRAPGNNAAATRLLHLSGERFGSGWSACPDRPPSEADPPAPLAHRLPASAHPVSLCLVYLRCATPRTPMGPRDAHSEGREGPSPRVRSLRLRLSVSSLLLHALPSTDQLPTRPGILGQTTPFGGAVLARQVESSAHWSISPKLSIREFGRDLTIIPSPPMAFLRRLRMGV